MERALTDWAVCRDDADPYKPPEWNPLYLAGCCDGRDITTSHIKEVLAPRLYRTLEYAHSGQPGRKSKHLPLPLQSRK